MAISWGGDDLPQKGGGMEENKKVKKKKTYQESLTNLFNKYPDIHKSRNSKSKITDFQKDKSFMSKVKPVQCKPWWEKGESPQKKKAPSEESKGDVHEESE